MQKRRLIMAGEEKIKKIELEHTWYLTLLQTVVLVLSSIAIFAIGYYSGKGTIGDAGILGWIVALIVIIIVFIVGFAWKSSVIRNRLKGQAGSGILIFFAFIAVIFFVGSISYGGFDNLKKEWFTYEPYLKSSYISSDTVYYNQQVYFYYTIKNPGGITFNPSISFIYDKNCLFKTSFEPEYIITLAPISPKSESAYYIDFTVVDKNCLFGKSSIGIFLYNASTNKIVDSKLVSFNIIRPTP
jgi:uncharacterized membrane protein YhaH (DUF805 family)